MFHFGRMLFYVTALAGVLTVIVSCVRWTFHMTDDVGLVTGLAWAAAVVLVGFCVAVICTPPER